MKSIWHYLGSQLRSLGKVVSVRLLPKGRCGGSKASKQGRLVEKKVCFISDAGNRGEAGRHLSKGRLLPSHQQARGDPNLLAY